MSHGRTLMFLLIATMVISSCSGFIAERSVNVPTPWNVPPSLETGQKLIVEHASSEKTQEAGADKVLQTTNMRTSTKAAEQTSPGNATRDRTSDFVFENVENDTHFAKFVNDTGVNPVEEHVTTESVTPGPRNVVLVLITEPGQDRENLWKYLKASPSFSVEGVLQSCYATEIDGGRFTLDEALVSGNKDKDCDCEQFLRSNVAALLIWARDVKGMTTVTLSNTNFTFPPLFGYEEPAAIAKEVDETDQNSMTPEIRKVKPEVHGEWHVIDQGKPSNHASSLLLTPNNREDGQEESMWNVFDMFSKIRFALFRSMLESLSGNVGALEDSIPSIKSRPLRSNLADVVGELKSLQNEKGFILVAATSASEINSALDILQRETSPDTLQVIAGACSQDGKPISFFAEGPSSKMLREATTVWDFPTVIKNVLGSGCQNSGCRVRRQDTASPSPAQPLALPRSAAANDQVSQNSTEQSVETSKSEASSSKDQAKRVAELNAKDGATKDDGKSTTPKLETRSMSDRK